MRRARSALSTRPPASAEWRIAISRTANASGAPHISQADPSGSRSGSISDAAPKLLRQGVCLRPAGGGTPPAPTRGHPSVRRPTLAPNTVLTFVGPLERGPMGAAFAQAFGIAAALAGLAARKGATGM